MKSLFKKIFQPAEAGKPEMDAWVQELASMDDISALNYSTQKLAKLLQEEELPTQDKLDLIILVEELNQPRLENLATQYVNVANLKSDLENKLTEACYQYCRQSYVFHLKVIEMIINPSKHQLVGDMPAFIIARAVNAAFNMSKWRMLVLQNPPTRVWLQIYTLYKIAHKQNLLNTLVELFPLSPPTSLSAFIVQNCMLGQLLQASMQKYHIEIAARILKNWLVRAYISHQYTPEQYLFFIDLESDMPAKRMRNFSPNENCRYWELNDIEKQIETALNVTSRGEIPESLLFAKIDNAKKLKETLEILHAEWRNKEYVRQRRKEQRIAASKTATVYAGISDICDQVLKANQIKNGMRVAKKGKSLDELLRTHTVLKGEKSFAVSSKTLDNWIITDMSKHGIGLRMNKYANIHAKSNKLVGIVVDDNFDKVIIGQIKSIKATRGDQQKVGVQVLSHKAIWVQIQITFEDSSFLNTVSEVNAMSRNTSLEAGLFAGILLPSEKDLIERSCLIFPKINFQPHKRYLLHVEGKHKRIKVGEACDSGDDWIKVELDL